MESRNTSKGSYNETTKTDKALTGLIGLYKKTRDDKQRFRKIPGEKARRAYKEEGWYVNKAPYHYFDWASGQDVSPSRGKNYVRGIEIQREKANRNSVVCSSSIEISWVPSGSGGQLRVSNDPYKGICVK